MSQIYPKIEATEAVVDSRQMLLDRDDANRTNNSGKTAPANVTPQDIGMTWFNTNDSLMYNLVSVNEDGSNPVWQKMANFNSFNVMNLGVLQEEVLYVDLEGPACDAKADMLVLVEHTMLPTENYEITQDGARVTFLQPVEAGLHLELRWFTKVIVARDGKTFVPSLTDGVLSWENDGGLPNPEPFDFNEAQAGVVAEGNTQVERITQLGDDIEGSINTAKSDFDSNAISKLNEYNANDTAKTETYNSNHEAKVQEFNNNSEEKTQSYNTNAQEKLDLYNANDVAKTDAFNQNATEKQASVDASAEEARKWAIGTEEERPDGSSKHWAEQAKLSADSVDADKIKRIGYEGLTELDCAGEVTLKLKDTDEIIALNVNDNTTVNFDLSEITFPKFFYTIQVYVVFPNGVKTVTLNAPADRPFYWINANVPNFSSGKAHWLVFRTGQNWPSIESSDAGEVG